MRILGETHPYWRTMIQNEVRYLGVVDFIGQKSISFSRDCGERKGNVTNVIRRGNAKHQLGTLKSTDGIAIVEFAVLGSKSTANKIF